MKKLITAGIILALVGSNIIIGNQYIHDSKEYERKIKTQTKIIKQYKISKQNDVSLIRNKSLEILILREQVSKKQKQIEQQQKELSKQHSPPKTYFEVTAYTANYESTQKRKGDKAYGLTASGTQVRDGVTIACPQSFDFGTKLNIEGVGLRICQDRGQAITSNKIDLYVASLNEAIQFGRRKLSVEVID